MKNLPSLLACIASLSTAYVPPQQHSHHRLAPTHPPSYPPSHPPVKPPSHSPIKPLTKHPPVKPPTYPPVKPPTRNFLAVKAGVVSGKYVGVRRASPLAELERIKVEGQMPPVTCKTPNDCDPICGVCAFIQCVDGACFCECPPKPTSKLTLKN
uniref:Uncharacterized protein n=1 Tax=Kalanchoe fedtschenkoi TaxID=63787 RepID=A0A7N0VDP6_KALFE